MQILVLGHGGHGKGTVAQIISDIMGLTFCSSSVFAFEKCIWPALGPSYLKTESNTALDKVACYKDRHNHRQEWFDLIAAYCEPKDRLVKELLKEYDIYDGMRSIDEYVASYRLFDMVLWVNRDDHVAQDPTMEISFDFGLNMIPIDNNGPISFTTRQLEGIMKLATS